MKPALSNVDYIVGCVRVIPRTVPDPIIFAGDVLTPPSALYLSLYPRDLLMTNSPYHTYSSVYLGSESIFKVSAGAAPSTVEIKAPYGVGGITKQMLEMNYLRGAKCYFFNTCWNTPVEDEQPLGLFLWGKTVTDDNEFTVELTHISDLLKQDTHMRFSKLCSNFFCDTDLGGNSKIRLAGRCGLDAATYTVTGTITSITSDKILVDSGRTEALDYFTNGLISFRNDLDLHGVDQNTYEIESFSGGVFTLATPPRCIANIVIGTTYIAMAGCRKRRDEDCVTRFSNGSKFNGFPDVPMPSSVYELGALK